MKKGYEIGSIVLRHLRYVFAALVLMLGISAASDMEVYGYYSYTDEQGVEYALSTADGNVAAVYGYEGTATEIVIPECVTTNDVTYKVIGIGSMRNLSVANQYPDLANQVYYANAFKNCETITTVTYEKPENIEYIGSNAFHWCFGLTGEAPIPSGCKYIGAAAFELCKGLQSMEIPEGALEVGTQTFYGCNSISENSIPSSLTSIGERAFAGCSSMTGTFILPSAITEIPDSMLSGCSSFTGLVLHDDVTKIGENAFANCASLTGTFTVPPKVTEIPAGMLSISVSNKYYNKTLTQIVLHDDITEIGAGAFRGLQGLESVTIPPLVTEIKNYTFEDCYNLTSIEIHDNVTSFGKGAFSMCVDLTGTMTVPEEMTEIPAELFSGCRSLTSIVLPENLTSIGAEAFSGCEKWTAEISLDGITSIGKGAFKTCELLTGIPVIPDEITEIPESAFADCTSLSGELVIPGNVKSVGLNAFSGCTGITGVILENGIETIGKQVFFGCEGLRDTALYIPDSVTSVGTNAFLNHYQRGYSSGKYICDMNIFCPQDKQFEEYNKAICVVSYKEETNGMLSLNVEKRFLDYEIGDTWINELKVPEKIFGKTVCMLTKVDDSYLYEDMGGYMTDLVIVDEAHYFNDWDQVAVSSHGRNCTICGNLFTEAHKYPNGNSACSKCGHIPFTLMSSLSQKVMQTGYTSGPVCTVKAVCKLAGENLTYQWYENNTAITGATAASYKVPTGKAAGTYTYTCKVSNGDYNAIATGVTFTVYKPEVVDGITLVDPSIESPEAGDYVKSADGKGIYKVITAVGGAYEVEYGRPVNKNLTSVTIPDTVAIGNVTYNVTSIADNAFKNCKKLKTLKIGNKVKKIGAKAFYGCKSLTKVTGGKALLTIGKSAFQGCSKLKTVSITSMKLKTIGAKTFYGCKKLTKITLKTTKLKKNSVGKNALKKTNKKLVIKVPKKKVSAYKKYFKGKGNNKAVVKK